MFLKQRTFNKRGNKTCISFLKIFFLFRWTAMWASDCCSQLLNRYSALFYCNLRLFIIFCCLLFLRNIFQQFQDWILHLQFKEIILDFDQHWLSLFWIFVCHPFPLVIFLVITSLSKGACLFLVEEHVHLDKMSYYHNHWNKIPSEMGVAPRFKLLALFTLLSLFTLLTLLPVITVWTSYCLHGRLKTPSQQKGYYAIHIIWV